MSDGELQALMKQLGVRLWQPPPAATFAEAQFNADASVGSVRVLGCPTCHGPAFLAVDETTNQLAPICLNCRKRVAKVPLK